MYRQGDVLLVPIDKLPANKGPVQLRDERCRIVLAEGEVTGHAHGITHDGARLYGEDLARRFLQVLDRGGVDLTHEEHATIHLPRGRYRVIRQRQWVYDTNLTHRGRARWVMD
jgi:hypothetical protein